MQTGKVWEVNMGLDLGTWTGKGKEEDLCLK